MQKTAHPKSLLRRLLAMILTPTIIMLIASYGAIYNISLVNMREQLQSSAQISLTQIGMELERFTQDVETITLSLVLNDDFITLADSDKSNLLSDIRARQAFVSTVSDQLAANSHLFAIMIINESGRLYGASRARTYWNEILYSASHSQNVILSNDFKWYGGRTDISFSEIFSSAYRATNSTPVIVCERRTGFGNVAYGHSSIMVCVKRTSFDDLFSAFTLPYETLCLLDENGSQIWSSNGVGDGMVPELYSKLATGGESFGTRVGNESVHVIDEKLPTLGWSIVAMVPQSYYTNAMKASLTTMILIALLTLLILVSICVMIITRLVKPLKTLSAGMRKLGEGALGTRVVEDAYISEYLAIARCFNNMAANLENSVIKLKHAETERREMEMVVLKAQINPHFLLNTMVSLRWIAVMARADSVAEAITHLCKLIEPLFRTTSDMWTVEKECDFIGHYVALMNVRFGNLVSFVQHIDNEALQYDIPRFIVQPLLENSYEHSIDGSRPVTVQLNIKCVNALLEVSVSDDGQGMPPDKLAMIKKALQDGRHAEHMDGIGQWNVWRRLFLRYGDCVKMEVDSKPHMGTDVRLQLPACKAVQLGTDTTWNKGA